jgi:hypothetical protein
VRVIALLLLTSTLYARWELPHDFVETSIVVGPCDRSAEYVLPPRSVEVDLPVETDLPCAYATAIDASGATRELAPLVVVFVDQPVPAPETPARFEVWL